MIRVFYDGACLPVNPGGIATWGFVIKRDGKVIKKSRGICRGVATNNIAEYTALIKALEFLKEKKLNNEDIVIHGDSQLSIYQMTGFYRVRSPNIIPLYKRAQELVKDFKNIRFEWVPRHLNKEADELSEKAYLSYLKRHPKVVERFKNHFATLKQKRLLNKLGIPYHKWTPKFEATRLIKEALGKHRQTRTR